MVAKQLLLSNRAPDGSLYAAQTNGNGKLASGSSKQLYGYNAPDGSNYVTFTDGNGNLI